MLASHWLLTVPVGKTGTSMHVTYVNKYLNVLQAST